jgi:hypothetical protein
MRFVDKKRRVLQRKPTESLYLRPPNKKKKEPHEVAEEKLPISASRTLRTSKLNRFINAANSLRSNSAAKYYEPIFTNRFYVTFQRKFLAPFQLTARSPAKELLGELGSLIGYRV